MIHPFTSEYIAMAKAAEEIQAMRPPFEPGDSVFITSERWNCQVWVGAVHYSEDDGIWSSYGEAEESMLPAFWLPRLDQLLGMLGGPEDLDGVIPGFEFWSERPDAGVAVWKGFAKFTKDWHELALAVVMKEKYGKTWRDGKWQKV